MKTLGVTGGIGSGKSTVCRILEELGARLFEADSAAKRILREDPDVRREIIAAFGEESYRPDGEVNRGYLAEHVFGSDERVEEINRIVHPRVFEAFEQARGRAEEEGVELLVHEAALIFEAGGDRHLDAVLVVDAPEEERIRRVMERDEVTANEVRARMRHQLPAEEKRRRADYVIENAGPLEELRARVERFYHEYLAG